MSVATTSPREAQPDLADLPFTELYVCLDDPSIISRWKPDITRTRENKMLTGNFAVPDHFAVPINEIREKLRDYVSVREIGAIMHGDLRLRYTITHAADEEIWVALRPIPLMVPTLQELQLNKTFIDLTMTAAKKKGLMLIGGETGQGKTTTSVSLLKSFCITYGGTLFTMEDPREYLLSGALSDRSWCIQHDIEDEKSWEELNKKAKRFNPDWLFFGEIRSREAAEQLISASARGHLVMTTVHSSNAADTIASLVSYLKPDDQETARKTIASRLLLSACQVMTPKGPYIQAVTPSNEKNDVIRNAIYEGNFGNLSHSIQKFSPK